MASMRQRRRADGTISYQVLFRHAGRQRSETFNTVEGQRRFHRNVEKLGVEHALEILNAADDTDADMPNLAEYIVQHIEALSGVTEGTVKRYRGMAKRLSGYPLGQMPLDAVTDRMVAAWIRARTAEGASGKTIKNEHSLVSAALERAVKAQIVPVNVAKGARIPDTVRDDMTILLPHEFATLYDRIPADAPHYRALAKFLYGTGARLGEATALQVRDYRPAESPPTVSIVRSWKYTGAQPVLGPPKTRRGRRTVSLPPEVDADMRELVKGKPADGLIFVLPDGRPIRQATLWRQWQKWIDDAAHDGPPLGKRPRIHDLRHSHASWMIGQGVNMLDLQHRLGHEDIGTTAGTYGHLLPEAHVQAARHANAMFGPGRAVLGS